MEQFKDLREPDWHFKNEKEASEYREWRNSITDELLYSLRLLDPRAYIEWDEEHHGVYVVYREIQTSFLEEPFLEEWFDYEKDAPALLKDLLKELGRRVNENILQNLWDLKNKPQPLETSVKNPNDSNPPESLPSIENSITNDEKDKSSREKTLEDEQTSDLTPLMKIQFSNAASDQIVVCENLNNLYKPGDFVLNEVSSQKYGSWARAALVIKTFSGLKSEIPPDFGKIVKKIPVCLYRETPEGDYENIEDVESLREAGVEKSWKINKNGELIQKSLKRPWGWHVDTFERHHQIFKDQLWYVGDSEWVSEVIKECGGEVVRTLTPEVQYILKPKESDWFSKELLKKAQIWNIPVIEYQDIKRRYQASKYYTLQ